MRAIVCVLVAATAVAQVPRFVPGMFVATPQGPVELTAFAELRSNGTLVMASGTLEDVPEVTPHATLRVLAALPNWPPAGVVAASAAIFTDEYAERRTLAFATRRLNVSSLELRIVDLETIASVTRLLRDIRASEKTPGFAFIIVASSGIRRFYPMRLTLPAQ